MEIAENLYGRRAALTALMVGVAMLALVIGVPAATAFLALHQETDDTLTQLARYRAELGLRPKLEQQLSELRQRGAVAPGLIVAQDSSLAEAQIQREVKSIVEANAGEVQSTQLATKKAVGSLEEITVQYDLTVPITRLNALLYAIESHTPYLYIDHADISAPLGWQFQPTANGKKPPEPKLQLRCSIHAYRWSAK